MGYKKPLQKAIETVNGWLEKWKEDMGFRRFLLRSAVKVEVEWTLLSLAYNVLKLHHKIQTGRLGTGLVVPNGFPAGL